MADGVIAESSAQQTQKKICCMYVYVCVRVCMYVTMLGLIKLLLMLMMLVIKMVCCVCCLCCLFVLFVLVYFVLFVLVYFVFICVCVCWVFIIFCCCVRWLVCGLFFAEQVSPPCLLQKTFVFVIFSLSQRSSSVLTKMVCAGETKRSWNEGSHHPSGNIMFSPFNDNILHDLVVSFSVTQQKTLKPKVTLIEKT